MRIGIDLDNTIVDYEISFSAATKFLDFDLPASVVSKYQIREYFRSQEDGEQLWQKLQGLAYGRFVQSHARLYPGVKRFLWRCKQKGHSVQIISHKTEFGHLDVEKLPIREIAIAFLESKGIFGGDDPLVQEITFAATREEKVDRISRQNFDWFIDDLPDIINDLDGSGQFKKVLFDPMENQISSISPDQITATSLSDWQQIDTLINGEWMLSEIKKLGRYLLKQDVMEVEKISNGGNAGVYKLVLFGNNTMKLKVYPIDAKHDRLHSEYLATKVINDLGETNISRPIVNDTSLGVGIYEWVEGDRIIKHDLKEIQLSLDFLHNLHSMRNALQFSEAPFASAACLSGVDIEKQLFNRFEQFNFARTIYLELNTFLSNDFLPIMYDLVRNAHEKWPLDSEYENILPRDKQTLSPSDFGFHNMIRRVDGKLTFLDFEYFGWDDPVKLISDFSFHPGMSLTDEQVAFWLKGALTIYGEEISGRLKICLPLYGLIWCLILLNDFRPEIWQRRLLAGKSKQAFQQQTLTTQLKKAQTLLAKIQLTYSENIITT